MKSDPKRFIRIMFALAIWTTAQSKVWAQKPPFPPPGHAGANSAISTGALIVEDHNHWQGVLKLAAKDNALITIDDIKSYFGKNLNEFIPGLYVIPHILRYQLSVPERLHELFPDRKQIYVEFFFNDQNSRTCLTREKIAPDLIRRGWRKLIAIPAYIEAGLDGGQPIHGLPEEIFVKGDQGVTTITYVNDCLNSVEIDANKIYFDQLVGKPAAEHHQ